MKLTLTIPNYAKAKISGNAVEFEFSVAGKYDRVDFETYLKLYDDQDAFVDDGKIATADNKIHMKHFD